MIRKRDLSQAQFEKRMRKLGWKPQGFLGYWGYAHGDDRQSEYCMSTLNYPTRRHALAAFEAKAEDLDAEQALRELEDMRR